MPGFVYPGDPCEYERLVRPLFQAAKRAYPAGVYDGGSLFWVLEPSLFDEQVLVLMQYCEDGNLHPVQHWMFRCDPCELCRWCHGGHGLGACRWHASLVWLYAASGWCMRACWSVDAFIERHIVLKLVILLLEAVLMCGFLAWFRVVSGSDDSLIAGGVIAIALMYVLVSSLAVCSWKKSRMSEQADISERED